MNSESSSAMELTTMSETPTLISDSYNNNTTHSATVDFTPWEKQVLRTVITFFNEYLPPVLITIGIIGNVLAFVVLKNPKFRKQSTCVYMRALACFDSYTLIVHTLQRYLLQMFPDPFWSLGDFFCKEYLFLGYLAWTISHWTIVLMTIDRFIAVRFPLQSSAICTTSRAKILIIVMTVTFITFHLQQFWRVVDDEGAVLKFKCPYDYRVIAQEYEIVFQHLFVTITLVIPIVCVFVFNVLIVYTVRASHKKHQELGIKQSTNTKQRRVGTDDQITVMLLLVSWVFTLTLTPFTLDHFIFDFGLSISANSSSRLALIRMMTYETSVNLQAINPCCNFFMYCLGCQKFRLVLRSLFNLRRDGLQKGTTQTKTSDVSVSEVF